MASTDYTKEIIIDMPEISDMKNDALATVR
jgi:hypothetical protein